MKIQISNCPCNTPCHPRVFLSWISTLLKKWMRFPLATCGNDSIVRGFTLIELLVVVLIIGILSAIALPQYEKAVEKSKAATVLSLLKSVAQAEEVFYFANGYYTQDLTELGVEIPWTGNTQWATNWGSSTLSNGEWSFQTNLVTKLHGPAFVSYNAIAMGRLTGDYKGAGFMYVLNVQPHDPLTPGLYCIERFDNGIIFEKEKGSYCHLFQQQTTQNPTRVLSSYLYRM